MTIILRPNPKRDAGLALTVEAAGILRSIGVQVCISAALAKDAAVPEWIEVYDEPPAADMIICFGGDGTILHEAKEAARRSVPILGVNTGKVGFMADLERDELHLIREAAEGRYVPDERIMLNVSVMRGGSVVFSDVVLNDAVVTRGDSARIIDLNVYSDGQLISEFAADGVVAATPTGSTAYSMAAGGPIVEPSADCVVITPICAHTMGARSFILSGHRTVTVETRSLTEKNAFISTDGGPSFKLTEHDRIVIKRSGLVTTLVRVKNKSFYDILITKKM